MLISVIMASAGHEVMHSIPGPGDAVQLCGVMGSYQFIINL